MNHPKLPESIENLIYLIRHQKVLLDTDLASLYKVETRALLQAIKRNPDRFPEDFCFQLSIQELRDLRSQNVISRWGGRRSPSYAFSEQGVEMLSSVLKGPQVAKVNVEIMRAFIRQSSASTV